MAFRISEVSVAVTAEGFYTDSSPQYFSIELSQLIYTTSSCITGVDCFSVLAYPCHIPNCSALDSGVSRDSVSRLLAGFLQGGVLLCWLPISFHVTTDYDKYFCIVNPQCVAVDEWCCTMIQHQVEIKCGWHIRSAFSKPAWSHRSIIPNIRCFENRDSPFKTWQSRSSERNK